MLDFVSDPFWNRCLQSLARPGASEFVANGPDSFFVTHKGVKERIEPPAEMNLRSYSKTLETNIVPLVSSRMNFDPDGYIFEGHYKADAGGGNAFEGRCHIALSPIAEVPYITMTKIASTSSTIESIAESGSMSTEMMQFLIMAVRAKLTIVLSGQSGAGKTTTLQALSKYFNEQDRIGVAEDIPELSFPQSNVTYLHTLPPRPGLDPNLVADLSFIVKQWLRMRPDRGIIGESRGKEFADFLVAANAGMKGSLTTIHASDPAGALDKMTRFALAGSERQPIRSINKEIGSAVDLVVQLARIDGKHRVTHIEEITSTVSNTEDARLSSETLYEYMPETDNWKKSGVMSDRLRKELTSAGIDIKPFTTGAVGTMLPKHNPGRANPNSNNGGGFSGENPFRSGPGRSI